MSLVSFPPDQWPRDGDADILRQICERLEKIEQLLAGMHRPAGISVDQEAVLAMARGESLEGYLRGKARNIPRRKRTGKG